MQKELKAFRKRHKLTQAEFCERCGIGRDLLSRLERGKIKEPQRMVQYGKIEEFMRTEDNKNGETE